jgi:hypothetical protein
MNIIISHRVTYTPENHDVVLENTATLPGEKPSEDISLSDTMFQNRNYPPKIQQIFRRISHSVGNYNIHYIASDHWKNPLLDVKLLGLSNLFF